MIRHHRNHWPLCQVSPSNVCVEVETTPHHRPHTNTGQRFGSHSHICGPHQDLKQCSEHDINSDNKIKRFGLEYHEILRLFEQNH